MNSHPRTGASNIFTYERTRGWLYEWVMSHMVNESRDANVSHGMQLGVLFRRAHTHTYTHTHTHIKR